ncbi:MAG: glutamate--tRNA ligase family protein [Methylacidiphilales bacterium]|nr:glutamate--tRNA ligase family protein [Candidatus Methylacidiphilales bacterium]
MDYSLPNNFIQKKIEEDIRLGMPKTSLRFRFPPEPNGRLHLGHAKAISLNFLLAKHFQAPCFLRYDDTNPMEETEEFYTEILNDIHWLGFRETSITYASDYFDQFYDIAIELIKNQNAYVDLDSAELIKLNRGSLTCPGIESAYRNQNQNENLALFEKMMRGDFNEGEAVLRAKIDMASRNMNLRDPILYRVLKKTHIRTGHTWNIYPMYDFAHPLSDCIEKISHSLCTLEFEDHRVLYNWVVDKANLGVKPQQIEFARLEIKGATTSKREIKAKIEQRLIEGWNDPRIATLSGLKSRGHPPQAIIDFCVRTGFGKANSEAEFSYFENISREYLNQNAPRSTAVLNPITCFLTDTSTNIERKLLVDLDDIRINPSKDFYRLTPQALVRLRHDSIIKCTSIDCTGDIIKSVHAEIIPNTFKQNLPNGEKVKGVIHWLDQSLAVPASFIIFKDGSYIMTNSYIHKDTPTNATVQFERVGYCIYNNETDFQNTRGVWIMTLPLRDSK